jgi:hypothetical protein
MALLSLGFDDQDEAASQYDVMVIIPQPDYRLIQIVFISQRAQACRAEVKVRARPTGLKSKPAGGNHP